MRKKDEGKKAAILNYIHEYYGNTRKTPVVTEIAAGTGIPTATVHRYILAMNESGELNYEGKRKIETHRMKKERSHPYLPVLGRVTCGPGDYEEEDVIEYIRMPEAMVGKGDFFALIAKGESMIEIGVHPDDYVIVRKQNTANIGDIVVALYDGGLNNLKKLCYDDAQQRYYLYSCNPDQDAYPPIYADDIQIQGVAVSVVHSLVQE